MKKLILYFIVITLISPHAAFSNVAADIVEPGMKTVLPCLIVENLNQNNEYYFFIYSELVGGMRQIKEGECTKIIYKLGDHRLVAVSREDVKDDWLNASVPGYIEGEKEILALASVIKSNILDLPESRQVPVASPDNGEEVLISVKIENNSLEVDIESVNGSVNWVSIFIIGFGIFIAITTLIIVLIVVVIRRKGKDKQVRKS